VSTRNLRLAAIHSFFKFLQTQDLKLFDHCAKILNIPTKKNVKPLMTYLSINETQTLFSLPNTDTPRGIRDLAILTTLYETGARVQELIDLTPSQLRLEDGKSSIELHGKGNKSRLVPVGDAFVSIINKYLAVADKKNNHSPLFYNSQGNKMTRSGIQYIIDKYIFVLKDKCASIATKKISNHTFRHSKAMHLLESGINIVYIRDFLGHSSVITTEIYAKVNQDHMRKNIETSARELDIDKKYSDKAKQDLTDWLKNLLKE
jgi:site-specific recombinase XerD